MDGNGDDTTWVSMELDHFLQLHLVGALEHEWIMTYIQLGMVSPTDWYFSYTSIGNVIIPIDFHSIIFQRGRAQPPVMIKVLRIADSSGGTSGPRDSGRRFWQTSTCHEEWMHLGVSKKLLLFAKIAICLWWTCWTCLNSKGDLHGFTMIWSTLIYGHLKHMYPKVNDDTRLRIYRDWCPKEWSNGKGFFSFFPTCQVRVVRFYVSCLLLLLSSSPLLLSSSCSTATLDHSGLCRTSTTTILLSGLCRTSTTTITASVPCRTSTAGIPAQCSLPDLNHDHPRPVFPAGPQPRPSPPSVPCRTSTTTIHAQCSLPDLNREYPRQVFPAGPHVGRYGTKNVQKKVRKNVRRYAR